MSAIFEMPADLAGKEIVIPQACLDLSIRFGLWKNYEQWLDADQQIQYWYDNSVLSQHPVHIRVQLGAAVLLDSDLDQFKTVSVSHKFSDIETCDHVLQLEITGLNALPIRDDTGVFVSGMFEIQKLDLMDINCLGLLDNTFHGNDITVSVPVSTPIYPYLVQNQFKILGHVFPTLDQS